MQLPSRPRQQAELAGGCPRLGPGSALLGSALLCSGASALARAAPRPHQSSAASSSPPPACALRSAAPSPRSPPTHPPTLGSPTRSPPRRSQPRLEWCPDASAPLSCRETSLLLLLPAVSLASRGAGDNRVYLEEDIIANFWSYSVSSVVWACN